jgi:hypothetical protein
MVLPALRICVCALDYRLLKSAQCIDLFFAVFL